MAKIEIGHGSGGRLTKDLIEGLFLKYLTCDELKPLEDASYIDLEGHRSAITTDSYVVRPIFFPGGNIGKLCVCGAVNDLVVSGARPRYLSLGFIMEEGFSLESLEEILKSIGDTAKNAGVRIVTGDTKVVEKNKCDGIFINTTGVGNVIKPLVVGGISEGDSVIVTGTVGDHGIAVAIAREEFNIDSPVISDCSPLGELLMPVLKIDGLKWMRDPTRGGVATVLAELSGHSGLGIEIFEDKVPVREDVRFISDMLGYDPLYLANEGKALIITSSDSADNVIMTLKEHTLGKNAEIIGNITSAFKGVRLRTRIGGERVLDLLEEELLPRIC
ncbi:MAG TPA: hydrogenase expression/formation protein HypE [Nitrospirae bacterium]|nr:hydrogenase isoenzymes formation protein HypE [bacterium BMS3Abin10]GBE39625.1 hydrogenase isoenzymes formation protein HypE [bacterium BMS3Bbin08]HDH01208.1 hydrogenase expression/formation protein HypE [Nitrospirota bacterium]